MVDIRPIVVVVSSCYRDKNQSGDYDRRARVTAHSKPSYFLPLALEDADPRCGDVENAVEAEEMRSTDDRSLNCLGAA